MVMSLKVAANENFHKKGLEIYVRLTYYSSHEDKFGAKVAWNQVKLAKEGRTMAASPKEFHFGQIVYVPSFHNIFKNNDIWRIEDCGKDLITRKASHGKTPVLDIFVNKGKKELLKFASRFPEYMKAVVF